MSSTSTTTLPNTMPPDRSDPNVILSMMPAILGSYPSKHTDIPVSAVFISIFACLAIINVSFFVFNKRRGIFFPLNMVTFGFCMSRITTFVLRIFWSRDISNKDLGTVAQIMISAGVVLLYIVNLILSKRLLDSRHPNVGRSMVVRTVFKLYYASMLVILALVIKAVVYRFGGKTMSSSDKTVLKFGPIWFTVFAFIPIPLSLATALVHSTHAITPLGTSSDRSSKWEKVALICGVSFFLTLGSAIRAGINFLPARPNSNPAWYHHRAVFYVFLPAVEICAVLILVVGRMDRKFFVGKQGVNQKDAEMESVEESQKKAGSSTSDSD